MDDYTRTYAGWTVGMEVLVLEGWYDASEIGQITEIDFEQEKPFLITFSDGEYIRAAPEQLSVVPPADYEELKQAVIAYLRVPTNVSRRELARLVGEPHDEASPPGSFLAARGILQWEEGDELPEDAIRRIRDED